MITVYFKIMVIFFCRAYRIVFSTHKSIRSRGKKLKKASNGVLIFSRKSFKISLFLSVTDAAGVVGFFVHLNLFSLAIFALVYFFICLTARFFAVALEGCLPTLFSGFLSGYFLLFCRSYPDLPYHHHYATLVYQITTTMPTLSYFWFDTFSRFFK